MKIKTKKKCKLKLKYMKPNPNQPNPGTPVQKKFEILSAVPYSSTASAICGPRIEPQNKVTDTLKGMVRLVRSKPHLKFCSCTEPI
jgi:hypothetical protein